MDNPVMTKWRHLFVQSQNMSMHESAGIAKRMFAEDKRIATLADLCAKQYTLCKFGDSSLYQQLMRVVEVQMFVFGVGRLRPFNRDQPNERIAKLMDTEYVNILPVLEHELQDVIDTCSPTDKMIFGSIRWLLLTRPDTASEVPMSARMVWTTLFAALWLCVNSHNVSAHQHLVAICTGVLGAEEVTLFSLVMCCMHMHFGLLPPRLYDFLLKINTTNLQYTSRFRWRPATESENGEAEEG